MVGNTVATGGASGTIANIGIASGTATVGTVGTTSGEFFGADGKISEDVIRIQDSFYYQDYSYVVKVLVNLLTSGEMRLSQQFILLVGMYLVRLKLLVVQITRITAQTVDSFTPELASTLRTLFITIFGRRLGTVDDGTIFESISKS